MSVLTVVGFAEELTLEAVRKSVYYKVKRAKAQGLNRLEFKTELDHNGNKFDVITSLVPFWATNNRNGSKSSTYAMGTCTISGMVGDREYQRVYKVLGTLINQGNGTKALSLQPYYSEQFNSKEHKDNFDKVMEQTLRMLFPTLFVELGDEVVPSISNDTESISSTEMSAHFRKSLMKRGCSDFTPDEDVVIEKELRGIQWRRVCGNCTGNGNCEKQAQLREQVKVVGVNMPVNA